MNVGQIDKTQAGEATMIAATFRIGDKKGLACCARKLKAYCYAQVSAAIRMNTGVHDGDIQAVKSKNTSGNIYITRRELRKFSTRNKDGEFSSG